MLGSCRDGPNPIQAFVRVLARGDSLVRIRSVFPGEIPGRSRLAHLSLLSSSKDEGWGGGAAKGFDKPAAFSEVVDGRCVTTGNHSYNGMRMPSLWPLAAQPWR